MTSATSVTSEGAQEIFSKVTFLKPVHSKEKFEACLGFLAKIFTKSLHRGGVECSDKCVLVPGWKNFLKIIRVLQLYSEIQSIDTYCQK